MIQMQSKPQSNTMFPLKHMPTNMSYVPFVLCLGKRIGCSAFGAIFTAWPPVFKITINTLVKIKHRSPWQRLSRGGTGPFASPKIPLGSVALEKVTNMFTRCCFESRFGSLMANSTGGHWRKCHDPTLGVECRCDTKHCLIWATVPQYRCLRARMSQCTAQKYPNPWA